ncbi:O-antigen ligase family protein [Vibrio chagasii]|uniref:O-antigen ligase family protein n=1 Tax=Vibrio chagasii TaxID=170679 RepID=UPI001EFD5420|nr:O-antigen ligase family protein [Vibrio chagasii]MCG9565856.1 O-antigen ligase family protein [Vibrio chagasii]
MRKLVSYYPATVCFLPALLAALSNVLGFESFLSSVLSRFFIGLISLIIIFFYFKRLYSLRGVDKVFLFCFLIFSFFIIFKSISFFLLSPPSYTHSDFKTYFSFFVTGSLFAFITSILVFGVSSVKEITNSFYSVTLFFCILFVFFSEPDIFYGRFAFKSVNPIICGVISLFLFYSSLEKAKSNQEFLLGGVGIVFAITTLIMSASRGPFVILFISLILVYVKDIKTIASLTVIACVSFFIFSYNIDLDSMEIFNRISETKDLKSTGRFDLFYNSFLAIIDNPTLGCCLETPNLWIYPHNIILESIMSAGIPLGGGMSLVMIYLFLSSVLGHKYDFVRLIYVASFLSSMATGSIYINSYFWVSMGAIISIGNNFKNEKKTINYNPTL